MTHQHNLFPVIDKSDGVTTRFLYLQCAVCNEKWTTGQMATALYEGDRASLDNDRQRETLRRLSQQTDLETRAKETAEVRLDTCRLQLQTAIETQAAMREEVEGVKRGAEADRLRAEQAEGSLADMLKAGEELLGEDAAWRLALLDQKIAAVREVTSNVIGRRVALDLAEHIGTVVWWCRRLMGRAAMWHDDSKVLAGIEPEREAAADVARSVEALLRSLEPADNGAYWIFDGYLPAVRAALATYAETLGDEAIGYEGDIAKNRQYFIAADALLKAAVFLIRNSYEVSEVRVTTGIASLNRLAEAVEAYRAAVGEAGMPFLKSLQESNQPVTSS